METEVMNRGRSPGLTKEVIFKLRGLLPVPIIFIVFAWSSPTPVSLLYGSLTMLAGECIRLWAAGYIRKYRVSEVQADQLVTAGPYARVRNPLYWGNFLIGLGFGVVANWWLGYILFLMLYAYIYSSVIPHEERYLADSFGNEYQTYRAEVPRLVPRFSRYSGAKGSYSLKVALTGEKITVAMWLVVLLLFVAKLYL